MSWLKDLVELVSSNWEIFKENIVFFIVYSIILIALTFGIFGLVVKFVKNKSDKEIVSLKKQLESLEKENKTLKAMLSEGEKRRLLLKFNDNKDSPLAESLSEHFSEKYSK